MNLSEREKTAQETSRIDVAAWIEEFLTELPEASDTVPGLMREHLEQARFYWLESALEEYGLSLKLAEGLLPEIPEKELRERLAAFLKRGRSPVVLNRT